MSEHSRLTRVLENNPALLTQTEAAAPAVMAELPLDRLFAYIRRFVSLSESQARAVALWVIHTHVCSAADATPYLAITSQEKQSGKTRLLEVCETLVANPWLTGRVTAAVLIRKIDQEAPTLLLDESDAAFGGEKEYAETLRGVLNTGHRPGGKASCCVGQGANISFRDFSTFCPKAIAGIGKLPDTVADRAIPIRLKRAAPGERIERFRARDIKAETASLREQVKAWAAMIAHKLRDARPELPDALTDRQQDGAEPLLAIADCAGGVWSKAARAALVKLCAEAQASDDSTGQQLLADIRTVFDSQGVDRLPSAELAVALAEIETSPWGEWFKGKPLTAPKLARLLRGFEIRPHSIRLSDSAKIPRGYERADFREAWLRYLRAVDAPSTLYTGPESATLPQPASVAAISDISKCHNHSGVAAQKRTQPASNGPCGSVAFSTPSREETGAALEEGEL